MFPSFPPSSNVLWPLCQVWQQPHPEPRESQEAILPVASPCAIGSCGSTCRPHPARRHAWKLHCSQALGVWLLASVTEQDNRQVKTFCGPFPFNTALISFSFVWFKPFLNASARLRWCGLPVSGSSPVMKLTSSGNVMLVTFSFSRQRDGAVFKAYFQAIPKAGLMLSQKNKQSTQSSVWVWWAYVEQSWWC